jgi:hypothetical protein
MALVASGAIAFSDVNVELGFSSTATIALNDAAVRTLFGIASGAIAMSDGYGKAATLGYVEDVFSTFVYSGNGSTQTITNNINLSGSGGLVWTKSRSNTYDHQLNDTVRGISRYFSSNSTGAQSGSDANSISSVSTTGYTLGFYSGWNNSSETYVSWTFRKAQKFFDIVTYTGNGSAPRNISHNLGSVPGCIMIKRTDTTGAWTVYHAGMGNTQALNLNTTAAASVSTVYWNNTTPTSSVFTLGSDANAFNAIGGTYVAYLFAHNAGGYGATGTDNIITCGSYVCGTGADVSVTLGYEPQWILIKNYEAGISVNWVLFDNMRGMPSTAETNSNAKMIFPNLSDAEDNNSAIKINSTGFVARVFVDQQVNAGSGTRNYIYMAIRRGPMKAITTATSVFYPLIRTGNGTETKLTGVGFPPDLVMSRAKNTAGLNTVWMARILETAQIESNTTSAGGSSSTQQIRPGTWGQDGVTLGSDAAQSGFNGSGDQNINLFFRRSPKFLDIVTYTGTSTGSPGTPQTITHNLGAVPELIIIKNRTDSDHGFVYAASIGAPDGVFWNLTAAKEDNSTRMNTTPTSTQFFVRTDAMVNKLSSVYVALLFATSPGVSKVGSYTGSGTTKQIECGFTSGARYIMIKRTDASGDWYLWNSASGISAGNDPYILWNSTAAEVTNTDYIDTYSAGFEISSTAPAAINNSGGSYIFLAIA